MAFNWRREPSNPYLPADGSLAQMATNSIAGYQPLTAMTPHGNGMNGYFSNNAIANQSQGFSVPNQQHGGMAQPDLEGYGASLQAASDAAAQAQAKEQQIASIKSQIQSLEARIAENQAKLKNWSSNGVADQIAAIEARKINGQDPTSIWRWKTERDEARRLANEQKNTSDNVVRANALFEIQNDLDSIIVDDKMTSQDQKAYLSKLSNLKTLAQKNNLPTDAIDKKIKQVKGEEQTEAKASPEDSKYEGTSRDQWDNEAKELLNKPNLTQGDIMKFKQKNPNLSNEVRQDLEKRHSEIIERDNKKNEAKKFEQFLKDNGFPNGSSGMNQMVLESMKRRWNKGKK